MAKKSVLDLVQETLSSLGSDNVNSIDDTQEATDVAKIVREVYFEILSESNWPHLRTMINLTGLGDTALPTSMTIADTIQKIDNDTIYYDARTTSTADPNYQRVLWKEPEEFLSIVLPRGLNVSDANIQEITSPVRLYIYNDRAPVNVTSFDDETLIFDAFDSDVDTTLAGTKSQVLAYKEPTFSLTDSHVPDLPSKNFPQFLAEVKSVAAIEIAQIVNPKQEQVSTRQRKRLQTEKWRTRDGIRFPDYGRKK